MAMIAMTTKSSIKVNARHLTPRDSIGPVVMGFMRFPDALTLQDGYHVSKRTFFTLPASPPDGWIIVSLRRRMAYVLFHMNRHLFFLCASFCLTGNLYRPRGKGNGPFPAVLNPCGHWPNGRLADTNNGSVPARCINFAKQGMIAFSYDMVGFNDMTQLGPHRRFFRAPKLQLWNISVMGL